MYSPLELLLFIAGCCTIADSFVPQLVNVPKATVNSVVRAVLSMSFVIGASVVVYNLKSRFCKEQAWNVSVGGGWLERGAQGLCVCVSGEGGGLLIVGSLGGRQSRKESVRGALQGGLKDGLAACMPEVSQCVPSGQGSTLSFADFVCRTVGGPCFALWRRLNGRTKDTSALKTLRPLSTNQPTVATC